MGSNMARRHKSRALGVLALASTVLGAAGCAGESSQSVAELHRRVAASTRQAEALRANPMQPMLGRWVIDADATLAENQSLSARMKAALYDNLTKFPFDLTITDVDYISHSWVKTNADRYTVQDEDGAAVTILLKSADGVERGPNRLAVLSVRDGNLLISNDMTPIVFVLRRQRGD